MRKSILFLFLTTCLFVSQQGNALNLPLVGNIGGQTETESYEGGEGLDLAGGFGGEETIVGADLAAGGNCRANSEPAENLPTICYKPYRYYVPQYYCKKECVEVPVYTKRKCCRMVPQYYTEKRCKMVPQYYSVQRCKMVPQYYCVTDCKSCKKYYNKKCCKYIPRYFYKKECSQPACSPCGGVESYGDVEGSYGDVEGSYDEAPAPRFGGGCASGRCGG
jgi:hypothetical protein